MPEFATMQGTTEEALVDFPVFRERGELSVEQYSVLRKPINSVRIASRTQGGKQLSYLEAWDVRAHLIRIFGFGNFDAHVVDARHVFTRDIEVGQDKKPGIEVAYMVTFALAIRDRHGRELCSFSESAVGSASGSVNYGDLHDNAVKQAESDALKRCAINLGNQFGLSLYDNGSRADVVRKPLIYPEGAETDTAQEATGADLSPEAAAALAHSLGATPVAQGQQPGPDSGMESGESNGQSDGPQWERKADTVADARAFADQARHADDALDPELR